MNYRSTWAAYRLKMSQKEKLRTYRLSQWNYIISACTKQFGDGSIRSRKFALSLLTHRHTGTQTGYSCGHIDNTGLWMHLLIYLPHMIAVCDRVQPSDSFLIEIKNAWFVQRNFDRKSLSATLEIEWTEMENIFNCHWYSADFLKITIYNIVAIDISCGNKPNCFDYFYYVWLFYYVYIATVNNGNGKYPCKEFQTNKSWMNHMKKKIVVACGVWLPGNCSSALFIICIPSLCIFFLKFVLCQSHLMSHRFIHSFWN